MSSLDAYYAERVELAEADTDRLRRILGEQEALALRYLARAEKAEAELTAIENDDEDHIIYQRVKKDADAAMKDALGECWNHLWGPGLEQLGHVVDAGMLRAEKSEAAYAELTRLYNALAGHNDVHVVERDAARAEVGRLRAALRSVVRCWDESSEGTSATDDALFAAISEARRTTSATPEQP
ncbi:MAG TPA: hypothetical protein VNJ04_05075 [Gemmatimonadaceae bacterium]|nr:hypothetical protein [Gemmatimonadaceae bacterium]